MSNRKTTIAKGLVIAALIAVVFTIADLCIVSSKEGMAIAEQLMKEKYSEDFHAEGIEDNRVLLRPAEMPDVIVKVSLDEKGERIASDNYLQRKIEKEVSDRTRGFLQGVNANMYVRTESALDFTKAEEGMSPKDYIKSNPGEEFRINIITDTSGQNLQKILDKIPEIRSSFGFDNGSIELILVDIGVVDKAQEWIEKTDSMYNIDVLETLEDSKKLTIPMSMFEPIPTLEQVNMGH